MIACFLKGSGIARVPRRLELVLQQFFWETLACEWHADCLRGNCALSGNYYPTEQLRSGWNLRFCAGWRAVSEGLWWLVSDRAMVNLEPLGLVLGCLGLEFLHFDS